MCYGCAKCIPSIEGLQNEGKKTDLKWSESLILLVGMKIDKQHLSDLLEQIDSWYSRNPAAITFQMNKHYLNK